MTATPPPLGTALTPGTPLALGLQTVPVGGLTLGPYDISGASSFGFILDLSTTAPAHTITLDVIPGDGSAPFTVAFPRSAGPWAPSPKGSGLAGFQCFGANKTPAPAPLGTTVSVTISIAAAATIGPRGVQVLAQ